MRFGGFGVLLLVLTLVRADAASAGPRKCSAGAAFGNGCILGGVLAEAKVLENHKNSGASGQPYFSTHQGIFTEPCHSKTKSCDRCPASDGRRYGDNCRVKEFPEIPRDARDLIRTGQGGVGSTVFAYLPSYDRFDPFGLDEGEAVPTAELQDAMNALLASTWRAEAPAGEDEIEKGICAAIQVLDDSLKSIYGCGRGSTSNAKLGKTGPTVEITSARVLSATPALVKNAVRFKVNWNSTGAEVKAHVKCKLEVRVDLALFKPKLGTTDKGCPDADAKASNLKATATGTATLVSRSPGTTSLEDVRVTSSNADVKLEACIGSPVNQCFNLTRALDRPLDKLLKRVLEKGLEKL